MVSFDSFLAQSDAVDPLSYFSFQPVLHDWYNKGRGMCYSVSGMVDINELLLLIGKSSPCVGSVLVLYNMSDTIKPNTLKYKRNKNKTTPLTHLPTKPTPKKQNNNNKQQNDIGF